MAKDEKDSDEMVNIFILVLTLFYTFNILHCFPTESLPFIVVQQLVPCYHELVIGSLHIKFNHFWFVFFSFELNYPPEKSLPEVVV